MANREAQKIATSLLLLAAIAGLAACETGEPKKTVAKPPVSSAPQPEAPITLLPALPPPTSAVRDLIPKPNIDLVDSIIKNSEAQFQQAEAYLKAGYLGKAKRGFDASLEIILRSSVPVSADERLRRQYESLIDRIFSYELAALKAGDGFTEEQYESAPIDEINIGEVPTTFDPKARQMAEETVKKMPHDLPLVVNDMVLQFMDYFQHRGHKAIEVGMQRAGLYRPLISKILAEEGVPQDLIYLCQAESGFRPLALSKASCRGLWQFAASRGKEYGLRQNWWIDERSDPEKSTRAAARHLKDLYAQFGDWTLAMAAYNTGPGNVERAVERTGYADYWELIKRGTLHPETTNYVPLIMAIAIISKEPQKYGFDVTPSSPIEADTVQLESAIDLRLVAESLDLSLSSVQALNPHVRRMTTPRNDPDFRLYVPRGMKDHFLEQIAGIPEDRRVSWRIHRVEEDEVLASIAKKYKTTASVIAEANSLDAGARLQIGDKLIIPMTAGRSPAPGMAAGKRVRYKVQRGDTTASVADDFNVTVAQLRKWNKLGASARLRPGQTLAIYPPGATEQASAPANATKKVVKASGTEPAKSPANRIIHQVKKGDTLYSIANNYNTSVASLCSWNNLRASQALKIGQRLAIYVDQ